MQDKVERAKGLAQVVDSLSPEGVMKMKDELMCAMDDIVNDLFSWKGEVEHLARCECTQGRWSRNHELIEHLEWPIRMVQLSVPRDKGYLGTQPSH
jgi:hypothetical protein